MTNNSDVSFLQFARFLKEKEDTTFQEVDRSRLSRDLFEDANPQRSVLPLYFFLTRGAECWMSVRQLKKAFNCGGDTIQRVRKAIQEKKPLEVPVGNGSTPSETTKHWLAS